MCRGSGDYVARIIQGVRNQPNAAACVTALLTFQTPICHHIISNHIIPYHHITISFIMNPCHYLCHRNISAFMIRFIIHHMSYVCLSSTYVPVYLSVPIYRLSYTDHGPCPYIIRLYRMIRYGQDGPYGTVHGYCSGLIGGHFFHPFLLGPFVSWDRDTTVHTCLNLLTLHRTTQNIKVRAFLSQSLAFLKS